MNAISLDTDPDEIDADEKKKKPLRKFRQKDKANSARQKRNYDQNKAKRAEYNKAMQQGDPWRDTEPPSGLNKLGAGDKTTRGNKSGTPHHRGSQNHEYRG